MFNDTEEQRKNSREAAIKRSEERGWILIGEIEWGDSYPFGKYKDDERPHFFYTRTFKGNEDKTYYEYTFGLGFIDPSYLCFNWVEEKRYSINTLLTSFISHDLVFEYSPMSGGRPILPSNKLQIRLVGSKDWLYPDVDFLNKKIDMDELELKFRTDKEKIMKNSKSLQENPYMTKEEIKNWKLIV